MPKILMVEDNVECCEYVRRYFQTHRPDIEVVFATHLREVPRLLTEGQWELIVWDERLPDGKASEGAIQAAKGIFTGPMIANSDTWKSVQKQMRAGCTHWTTTGCDVIKVILHLLPKDA